MSFLFACVCFELGVQYCLSMGVPLMGCGNLDDSVAVLIVARGCAVFIIAMKSKLLILCQEGREYKINDTILSIVSNLLTTKFLVVFSYENIRRLKYDQYNENYLQWRIHYGNIRKYMQRRCSMWNGGL